MNDSDCVYVFNYAGPLGDWHIITTPKALEVYMPYIAMIDAADGSLPGVGSRQPTPFNVSAYYINLEGREP